MSSVANDVSERVRMRVPSVVSMDFSGRFLAECEPKDVVSIAGVV